MADIAPRDWRLKAREIRHEHTKEVTKQELPSEVQELLLEMADTIRKHETKIFELERTVGAFGAVTLNDLLKKSA